MTPEEVHQKLRELKRKFQEESDQIINICPDAECEECARIVCPFEDPLHFHHDGCPSCST